MKTTDINELAPDQLAEIGRLSVRAHITQLAADEHRDRAEAEGWDDDPTGSCWVAESRQIASRAHNDWVMKMSELGLLRDFEND